LLLTLKLKLCVLYVSLEQQLTAAAREQMPRMQMPRMQAMQAGRPERQTSVTRGTESPQIHESDYNLATPLCLEGLLHEYLYLLVPFHHPDH
jgi:hypothetical protein